MKHLAIACLALSLAAFAGCKKKSPVSEELDKWATFKDRMCKCTDKACADLVSESVTSWNSEPPRPVDKMAGASNEEIMERAKTIEAATRCMTRAMAGGVAAGNN